MKRIMYVLILIIVLTACKSNNSKQMDPSMIDLNLDVIVNNHKVSMSSNPMDYISANQAIYDEIINNGSQGLDYLVEKLKQSQVNGLKEWIIAKACDDILKDKVPNFEWDSGKDWLNKYEATRD